MAMATSPSRLDPPRVAILPTATPGNNNSVLIPKVHMSTKKRKMCVERATARQPREQLWLEPWRQPAQDPFRQTQHEPTTNTDVSVR